MAFAASCFLLVVALVAASASADSFYCGETNCYDVLGLTEKAKLSDVKKAYRALSMEWHPDKSKHADAAKKFAVIGHAYGILSDEEQRRDYDYALRHPERRAYNQARYYYGQYYRKNVKVNPFLVIAGFLVSYSAFQYISMKYAYEASLKRFQESHKYKMALKQLKAEKLEALEREKGKASSKAVGKKGKKELDAVEVDESVLIDRIKIHGGGGKPVIKDLVIFQAFLWPLYIAKFTIWQIQWYIRYSYRKEEYDDEAKAHLTRSVINMSPEFWNGLEEKKRAEFLGKELWVPENEKKWRESQRGVWD